MIVTSIGTVLALSDGARTNLQDLMLVLGLIDFANADAVSERPYPTGEA